MAEPYSLNLDLRRPLASANDQLIVGDPDAVSRSFIPRGPANAAINLDSRPPSVGGYNDLLNAVDAGCEELLEFDIRGLVISVTAALDYGSAALVTFGNRPQIVRACQADLTVVKQGNANGIVAATVTNFAVGTAAASNSTLSGTMVNVLGTAAVGTALSNPVERSEATNLAIAAGAANQLFLNISTGDITADSSVTLTGRLRVWVLGLPAYVTTF